jgi:hypothetical protein
MNLAEANRTLRLSDSQLAIVRRGATTLRPADDATVGAVVETVLATIVDK